MSQAEPEPQVIQIEAEAAVDDVPQDAPQIEEEVRQNQAVQEYVHEQVDEDDESLIDQLMATAHEHDKEDEMKREAI